MKRYQMVLKGDTGMISLEPHPEGTWLRFEDVESWGSKKVQSLIDERDKLLADYEATRAINVRLQWEVDELRAIVVGRDGSRS